MFVEVLYQSAGFSDGYRRDVVIEAIASESSEECDVIVLFTSLTVSLIVTGKS